LATLATPIIRSIKRKQSPVYGVVLTVTATSLYRSQRNTNLVFPFPLGNFPQNLVQIRPQSF